MKPWDEFAARVAIYRMMRPGEPPDEDAVQAPFQCLFYNADTYDLSRVGRMKFNAKIGSRRCDRSPWCRPTKTSWPWSRLAVDLRNGCGEADDIDHLATPPRVAGRTGRKPVPHRSGTYEKAVKERLGQAEQDPLMPSTMTRSTVSPISAAPGREFLRCVAAVAVHGPDQTSGRNHATSASCIGLGPGGLTCERAGFEVRDARATHYGRVCPIETPEGPNIGLINSLALYARLNEYGGFI